jgi:large subunit ribosomal protein L28
MSRTCKLTGKKPLVGNHVSHANNKTKRRQYPNLQLKRIYVPELDRTVRIRMSVAAIRTITKIGLMPFLKKQGLQLREVL